MTNKTHLRFTIAKILLSLVLLTSLAPKIALAQANPNPQSNNLPAISDFFSKNKFTDIQI